MIQFIPLRKIDLNLSKTNSIFKNYIRIFMRHIVRRYVNVLEILNFKKEVKYEK